MKNANGISSAETLAKTYLVGINTSRDSIVYNFGFEKWAQLPKVANMDGIERDLIILGKRI